MLITSLLVQSTTSYAATCEEKLPACDRALTAADELIKRQDNVIKTQTDLILAQKTTIEALQDRDSKFYNQPWFWAVVGAVGTSLIIRGSGK